MAKFLFYSQAIDVQNIICNIHEQSNNRKLASTPKGMVAISSVLNIEEKTYKSLFKLNILKINTINKVPKKKRAPKNHTFPFYHEKKILVKGSIYSVAGFT